MAATSSAPSAEPCAASVFCACGAGQAMIERIAMKEGREVSSRAASSASYRACTSTLPLNAGSIRWTCQPYASYRLSTSSENAVAVSPSMEMWLSSYRKTRLPSFWWPASDEASAEMPSSRSPSETIAQMVWSNGDAPSGASGSNRPRS